MPGIVSVQSVFINEEDSKILYNSVTCDIDIFSLDLFHVRFHKAPKTKENCLCTKIYIVGIKELLSVRARRMGDEIITLKLKKN